MFFRMARQVMESDGFVAAYQGVAAKKKPRLSAGSRLIGSLHRRRSRGLFGEAVRRRAFSASVTNAL